MEAALSGPDAIVLFKRMRAAAVRIQTIFRGVMAKKKLAFLRYSEGQEWLHSRATLIASVWRTHIEIGRFHVLVAAAIAKEKADRREAAATQIQKQCRAYLRRIKYLAQLKVRKLDPRLRHHAEKFIGKGDIWTVLERVDMDFRFIDHEYKEEKDNVRVFIKNVLEPRENDMRYLKLDFQHAVHTNENAQAARSLNNKVLSDFDRVTMTAVQNLDSMVERSQAEARQLAMSKMRYFEKLQPKKANMTGSSVQLDSGPMKDDNPFEVRSMDGPVHPLIMLSIALTYPPEGRSGRSMVNNWLESSLSLKKVQQREFIRQRAAPFVATLREAGIHTVRDLEGVSLLSHGFPLPLRNTLQRELQRVRQEHTKRVKAAAAAQRRLDRQARNAKKKNKKAVSSFVMPEGLLRSEQQIYAPKNFVGKLVKPSRARQQALKWLKQLDKSYNVTHLDDPHDKFITYVFLRFLTSRELEEFELNWKEQEQRRQRKGDRRPVKVEPEQGDTFVDFLQHLVQKEDTAYRKQVMARRSQRAFRCAEATILRLKKEGYKTVRSLLLCPFQAIGIDSEPAAEIALGIKKMSKANPWLLTKFRDCDTRFQRSPSDLAVVPSEKPLPPLIVPRPLAEKQSLKIAGGKKRVRHRMKSINASRPHPRDVANYDGVKSTAKAFVRLKAQALLEMSYGHADGRDYHKWKNDQKLTRNVMLKREKKHMETMRAEQQRREEADFSKNYSSTFASLMPPKKIMHPLERLAADDHMESLWPIELHEAMAKSAQSSI